jgi:hypothetical protein
MGRPSTTTRIVATLVGLAYAVALYLSGVHLQHGVKDIVAYLPTVATFLVGAWDVWLWHLPGAQQMSGRPWLTGTWAATLQPTVDSHIPEGGNRGPITAYVVIKQSFWSIAIRQYTAESRSESRAAAWADASGGNQLTYMYANRPRQELEGRSRPHLGTTALDVVGLRPSGLTGEYFTDRYTKGDMALRLVDRTTKHIDFASAQAHCEHAAHLHGSGRKRRLVGARNSGK